MILHLQDRPDASVYANCARCLQFDLNDESAIQALTEGLERYPDDVRLMTEKTVWADNRTQKHLITRYSDAELQNIRVEIIVCVHNAFDHVVRCLSSVFAETRSPFGMIIVDDASDPETQLYLEELQKAHDNVQLLRNDINLGYTRSANRGLSFSQAEWVVLLNSDTIVTADWLDGLLACAAQDSNVRAVGPLSNSATFQSVPHVHDDADQRHIDNLPSGWTPADVNRVIREIIRENNLSPSISVPILNGFCTLFHRPTIASLGYLDEALFPVGYGEENDLCLRMARAGYRLVIALGVYVYHKKSASFGDKNRKRLTREAVVRLKAKWPGYSYRYISQRIAEIPDLGKLRENFLEIEAARKGDHIRQLYHPDRRP